MKTKILATSSSCGPCHMIKSKIQKLGLTVDIKDFSDPVNREWFTKHDIKAVPRLVIEDGDDVQIIQGMDDIIEAIRN
jgi:glutaredoxin